ncbi:A2ML1 protein, partial [Fregata magnificens]|nr:A2ML1 protein [Fregata magnificens]
QTGRNGCFSTEVPASSFNLTSFSYEGWLNAYASLLEEGTGMSRTANKRCMIVYETTMITFENTDKFYKPGIPYTGMMLLKATNGSALKEKEFLLVVNARGETQRKTLLTDGSGRASFELDTSGWNDKVSLQNDPPASEHEDKEYLNNPSVTRYLYPYSSDSKSFLKIHRVEKKLPCGQPQQLRVDYLFDEKAMGIKLQSLDVVFLVLAKGTIATVLRKELRAEAGLRGSFSLELPIGPELAPTAKVLGYAVLPDSEMVADSTELKVAKCFPNKVNLSFWEERALVGSRLRVKMQAAPGSLCAIYTVDQRTRSSGPKGKLNPSMVYNLLPTFSGESYTSEVEEHDLPHCRKKGFESGMTAALPSINCFDMPRRSWRHCRYSVQRREAPVLSCRQGMPQEIRALMVPLPISKYVMATNGPQDLEEGGWHAPSPGSVHQTQPARSVHLLSPCREGGSAEVMVTVPDAITEWEAGMFCTAPLGLGLAPATTLTAFKPFFVELALPYAVVRHEAFTLVAIVFNNLRQCLQVQVTLAESAELEVLAGTDGVYRGCVCADEERTFQWSVRATSLGEVNVTVIAKALRSEKLCGTEMPVVPAQGCVDTETKLLMVQVS